MYLCIHDKPTNVFFCGNDVDSTSLNKRWKALVSVYSNLIFSQPSSRVPSRYKSFSLKSLWEISWWPKTNQIQIDLLQFSYLMGATTTWRCKQFLHQTFLDITKNFHCYISLFNEIKYYHVSGFKILFFTNPDTITYYPFMWI